jgi:hypothetical protein
MSEKSKKQTVTQSNALVSLLSPQEHKRLVHHCKGVATNIPGYNIHRLMHEEMKLITHIQIRKACELSLLNFEDVDEEAENANIDDMEDVQAYLTLLKRRHQVDVYAKSGKWDIYRLKLDSTQLAWIVHRDYISGVKDKLPGDNIVRLDKFEGTHVIVSDTGESNFGTFTRNTLLEMHESTEYKNRYFYQYANGEDGGTQVTLCRVGNQTVGIFLADWHDDGDENEEDEGEEAEQHTMKQDTAHTRAVLGKKLNVIELNNKRIETKLNELTQHTIQTTYLGCRKCFIHKTPPKSVVFMYTSKDPPVDVYKCSNDDFIYKPIDVNMAVDTNVDANKTKTQKHRKNKVVKQSTVQSTKTTDESELHTTYKGCKECSENKTPPTSVRYKTTLMSYPGIDVYECSNGHTTHIRRSKPPPLQSIPRR